MYHPSRAQALPVRSSGWCLTCVVWENDSNLAAQASPGLSVPKSRLRQRPPEVAAPFQHGTLVPRAAARPARPRLQASCRKIHRKVSDAAATCSVNGVSIVIGMLASDRDSPCNFPSLLLVLLADVSTSPKQNERIYHRGHGQ